MYFTAATGGESHLFRVSVPGGKVEQVTKGERRIGGLTFDRAMKRIAYTVSTHDQPGEVYSANIDGTGEKKLERRQRRVLRVEADRQDRTAAVAEQGRHADRRLADVSRRRSIRLAATTR